MVALTFRAKFGTWHMTATSAKGKVILNDWDSGLTMIVSPKRLPALMVKCGYEPEKYIVVVT